MHWRIESARECLKLRNYVSASEYGLFVAQDAAAGKVDLSYEERREIGAVMGELTELPASALRRIPRALKIAENVIAWLSTQ